MFDAAVSMIFFLLFDNVFTSNGLTGYFLSVFNTQHNFWQSLAGKVLLIWNFLDDLSLSGPSSPIIEVLKPVPGGLNISWRTDVTSKQEKYVIIYTRNDTGQVMRLQTTEKAVSITELFPGAGYQIQVYAVSHGLQSEPHDSFQIVPPLPPLELRVVGVVETNVSLAWRAPADSLYTEFLVRWRARSEEAQWREESVGGEREEYTLQNMDPGQMFSLQLDTASHHVVSGQPITATMILRAGAVSLSVEEPAPPLAAAG